MRTVAIAALVICGTACSGSDGSDDDGAAVEGESWCDVVASANALDTEFDAVADGDAGAMKTVLDEISGLGDRFRATAPDEISSQVEAYADANDALIQVFVDADYDVDQLDSDAVQAALGSVEGVDTEIDVYTVAECGDSLGPDDT